MAEKQWSYTHGPSSTHYTGCWKNHIYCALGLARDWIQEIADNPTDIDVESLAAFLKGTEPEPLATLDSSTEQEKRS